MRTATLAGRMALVCHGQPVDVETASAGLFPADPSAVFERWAEFRAWAESADIHPRSDPPSDLRSEVQPRLGPPSPAPRQVFAIGLNYADHAAEAGFAVPTSPATFTKFPTSITGPRGELRLPSGVVDWEAELVVVIGRRTERVTYDKAWSYVAGLTVGQDFSERAVQMTGAAPQFSLGKSFPGFGPTGPHLVTADELADPDDLGVECSINGEVVQSSRTSQLTFSVAELIVRLSAVCALLPGDLIFTGTPAGVGMSRTPARYLQPGDEVVTVIEGLGQMVQLCVDGSRPEAGDHSDG